MVRLNLSQKEDQELMNLLAESNLDAWSELVKRYGKLAYSIAYQILNNSSDAEDAVQNTFMRLKIYANKFDISQPLRPWLSRIASGEAIRIYQKKKKSNLKESIPMDAKNSSSHSQRRDVAEIVEEQEVESLIKKAIAQLPETSRVALTLYYAGGLNQSEIAVELGVSQVSISEKIKSSLEKVKLYLKKAGIQAAIVLSPNLMQEGIISLSPPKDFIFKLANSIPPESQLAQLASSSVRLGVSTANKKTSIAWLLPLLAFSFTIFLGYLYWPSKSEIVSVPVVKKAEPVISKQENKFQPIDFKNYDAFYLKKGLIQKDISRPDLLEEGDIQFFGGEKKWKINQDSSGRIKIYREKSASGLSDGLYLAGSFSKPHVFKGTIKTFSEKNKVGFLLKLPIDKIAKEEKVVGNDLDKDQILNVGGNFNEICSVNVIEPLEMDIKIFVWSNKTKWLSASFIYVKGNPEKYFKSGFLTHLNENFRFGIFSNSKLEGTNFEYCPLDPDWNYANEPEIKAVLNKFPKDFFLENTESK